MLNWSSFDIFGFGTPFTFWHLVPLPPLRWLDFDDGTNFKGFFWQSVTKVVLKGLDSFCGWQVASPTLLFSDFQNVEKVKIKIHFRISCASKTQCSSSFRNQLFVCVRLQNMSKHVKMVQPKGSGCQSTRSSLRSQGIIMFTKPRKWAAEFSMLWW